MSHDPSRKRFLGKLIGLAAVAGFAPRMLAKMTSASVASDATKNNAAPASFTLRSESRAVARRADSV